MSKYLVFPEVVQMSRLRLFYFYATRFFTSGFFHQPVPPGPSTDMPRNNLNLLLLFAEIFNYFGALLASTSPAKHALLVSLKPVTNSSPVSTTPVSDTFTVLESFTGVNDTGKKLLTGVIDTSEACIRRCQ